MGGYGAHDAVASVTRSPLSLKRHSMLTWTEKGERLDAEMHSIHLFSDAYTRQVEALTQKSPFRRFIQSTHTYYHCADSTAHKIPHNQSPQDYAQVLSSPTSDWHDQPPQVGVLVHYQLVRRRKSEGSHL